MRQIKYGKYIRGVWKRNKGKRIPVRSMIELTYVCNHKCRHCYNPAIEKQRELGTEEIFSVIDQMTEMGTRQISFTGGEIFTRPDIMDIIYHSRKRGLIVSLLTNGTLITEGIADKLISWGVIKFEISMLGGSRETCDKMTGVKGSFDRIVGALKMLRAKGVVPIMKTCVVDINIDEIEQMARLAKALNVTFRYSPGIIPKLDLSPDPLKCRIDAESYVDMKRRVREIIGRIDDRQGKSNRGKIRMAKRKERLGFWERDKLFNCMAGNTCIFIDPYGRMKTCMILPEPSFDLRSMTVREGWENIKRFVDSLVKPEDWACLSCDVRDWCSWCPGRSYVSTGSIFGCSNYHKEIAGIRSQRVKMSGK